MTSPSTATSADGTTIAYETSGSGPALVLVDGALCSRAFGPGRDLAAALADRFTVYLYDRRGRGDSGAGTGGTQRELEDLTAVVTTTGEVPFVLGQSSGAALALEAAASGMPMRALAVYEAPYIGGEAAAGYQAALEAKLAKGDRAGAVGFFLVDMVGAPFFVPYLMRMMSKPWKAMQEAAPTLPNDAAILGDFTVPASRFATISVPTLVMGGSKGKANMKQAVRGVATAVPGSTFRELTGQTHQVSASALAQPVAEFFGGR